MCFLQSKKTAKQAAHYINRGITGGNNLYGEKNKTDAGEQSI